MYFVQSLLSEGLAHISFIRARKPLPEHSAGAEIGFFPHSIQKTLGELKTSALACQTNAIAAIDEQYISLYLEVFNYSIVTYFTFTLK
jgi:hypothetical protein